MKYGELIQTQIPSSTHKIIVLPIGSLEQHGHHLPMLTDTLIGVEIARRVEAELEEEVLFLPFLWVGASNHHLGLPGAVSASNDTYTQLLMDILESLIRHGFRKIVLLNSHGGNGGPAGNAIYQTQQHHPELSDLWLVLASWFTIAAPQIAALPSLEQKHVTHACELETSMILHLRPELVKMDAARGANIPFNSQFWSADSSGSSRVSVARSFHQTTETGSLGNPEIATAEKGSELLDVAVNEIVSFLRELMTWENFDPA